MGKVLWYLHSALQGIGPGLRSIKTSMNFIALIAALALEQFRPLGNRPRLFRPFTRYANVLERHFNAGQNHHGIIAWCLAVLPPALAITVVTWGLYEISFLLALAWNMALLYICLNFGQTTRQSTSIAEALRRGEVDEARRLLAQWSGRPTEDFSSSDIARTSIEQSLLCAHRQIFGVVFWFGLLGAGGIAIYRLSHLLHQKWGLLDNKEFGDFGRFSAQALYWLDWVPVRLTALTFAVVGDFVASVDCWRNQAGTWPDESNGIILASGAGAMGIRLGEPLRFGPDTEFRPELGVGDEPDADDVDSAPIMVWRGVIVWLIIILLMTLASWAG